MARPLPENTDNYISWFPAETQKILKQIRTTIKKAAPSAKEKISYGIPAFTLNGRPFIYFAGFAKHVSVYPAPRRVEEFKKELSAYKGGKGTVQFPLAEPIPLDLITRIAKFRLKESMAKATIKEKAKKTAYGKKAKVYRVAQMK